MTQPSNLAPWGPVGMQQEWDAGALGRTRSVLGAPSAVTLLATDTNVRYVDPGGSDATGNGSRAAPFRTVAPAIAACLAAGATLANPFAVRVSPGAGYGSFALAANVYVIGSGSGSGNYNGSPISGVTFLAPTAAQSLGASFAGAAGPSTGIIAASLTTNFKADFNAIGSTGPASILLQDVLSEGSLDFVGNAAGLQFATMQSVYLNGSLACTLTDMGGSFIAACGSDFGAALSFVQAAAIQSFHRVMGSSFDIVKTNWTSALQSNFLSLVIVATLENCLNDGFSNIVGTGSQVVAPGTTIDRVMSDAANRLSFGTSAAATIIGVSGAKNYIRCTPTAARVLTIDRPQVGPTEIIIQNLSATFPIDLTFAAGAVASGSPTYCPPLMQMHIFYNDAQRAGTTLWEIRPIVQSGTVALTNGVSAAIPADIWSGSSIVVTRKTFNGAAGDPAALNGDRVVGTRAGGGSFKVTGAALATGLAVATDQGTCDWHVTGGFST